MTKMETIDAWHYPAHGPVFHRPGEFELLVAAVLWRPNYRLSAFAFELSEVNGSRFIRDVRVSENPFLSSRVRGLLGGIARGAEFLHPGSSLKTPTDNSSIREAISGPDPYGALRRFEGARDIGARIANICVHRIRLSAASIAGSDPRLVRLRAIATEAARQQAREFDIADEMFLRVNAMPDDDWYYE